MDKISLLNFVGGKLNTITNHNHTMALTRTHASGAEEWECPECGRKFVVQWSPNFKRVVLVNGNAHATHAISKGGLHINSTQARPILDEQKDIYDEELAVWRDHVDAIDFDHPLSGLS